MESNAASAQTHRAQLGQAIQRLVAINDETVRLANAAQRAQQRFTAALRSDRDALEATFGILGDIRHLTRGLSDPHHGNQTVVRVDFASGTTLLYKPRSVAMDVAFAALVQWMNDHGAPHRLRAARVLDRGDHGWAECIRATGDEAGYFVRAGALLCLLHLLEATDCHRQNIIASDGTPVLIDCETLLAPRLGAGATPDDDTTVLRTGFLPRWRPAEPGLQDIGGLYAVSSDPQRRLSRSEAAEIGRGFADTYRWLMTQRDVPLDAFRGVRVRVVFRPTHLYARLLDPAAQNRRGRFELLRRSLALHEGRDVYRPLIDAEIAALERFDVPWFHSLTNEHHVLDQDAVVAANAIPIPSLELVQRRFEAMSEGDLARQLSCIGACAAETTLDVIHDDLSIAREIGAEIVRHAIPLDGGGTAWVAPRYSPTYREVHLQRIHGSLYEGNAGVALFLAALAHVTHDPDFAVAARRALAPVLTRAESDDAWLRRKGELGIGGTIGAGSLLYVLSRASQWLDDPSLLAIAKGIVRRIPEDAVRTDETLDVMSGVAGLALALCALDDDRARTLATMCVQRLVETATPQARGLAWFTTNAYPTGFAHGAAGILCALLRAGETGLAARGAIAFLASTREPQSGQWLREIPAVPNQIAGWCHGAPGIGLALLGVDEPLAREAVTATLNADTSDRNDVCCGSFARLELLLAAGIDAPHPPTPPRAFDDLGFDPSFFKGAAGAGYHFLRRAHRELPCVLTLS